MEMQCEGTDLRYWAYSELYLTVPKASFCLPILKCCSIELVIRLLCVLSKLYRVVNRSVQWNQWLILWQIVSGFVSLSTIQPQCSWAKWSGWKTATLLTTRVYMQEVENSNSQSHKIIWSFLLQLLTFHCHAPFLSWCINRMINRCS